MYDQTTHAFSDVPDECRPLNADRHCISCGREAEEELMQSVQVVDCKTGLAQHSAVYHVADFVYVKPDVEKNKGVPFFIAQVTRIDFKNKYLHVRYYDKHAEDPVCPIIFESLSPYSFYNNSDEYTRRVAGTTLPSTT